MAISMKSLDTRVTALENKGGNGIGFGQKWYDMTSKRKFGTTYTNNTGLPIMVSHYESGGGGYRNVFVDGLYIATTAGSIDFDAPYTFIVPNGSTYRIDSNYRNTIWAELRSDNLYYKLSVFIKSLFRKMEVIL